MRRVLAMGLLLILLLSGAFVLLRPPSVRGPLPPPPEGDPDQVVLVSGGVPIDPRLAILPADGIVEEGVENRADWPVVIGRPGIVPEEMLGRGDQALFLRFRDAATHEPVAQDVWLWRLDLPEAGTWSAGDQIERTLKIAKEGLLVRGLAKGRYRLECPGQRKGAPDPRAFDVAGGTTVREFELELPRPFTIRLIVFDEMGRRIGKAGRAASGIRTKSNTNGAPGPASPPSWAKPRDTLQVRRLLIGGGGFHRLAYPTSLTPMKAGRDGFDLGTLREPSGLESRFRGMRIVPPGRSEVRCHLASELASDPTLVAIAVPTKVLIRDVFFPDGRHVTEALRFAMGIGRATPLGRRDQGRVWRELPVSVTVDANGYERLEFEWKASDAGLVRRTMVPLTRGE